MQIDTRTPVTHSIDYVVTDASGLTATSTRTVFVAAPQAANDNQETSSAPAANDNPPTADTTTYTGT